MKSVRFVQNAVQPSKIICVGRNYVEHIHELGNDVPDDLVVFNKPNSAISTHLQAFHEEPLHYEAELCLLVRGGRYAGVGFGLDLTKRQLQGELKQKGLPWERAKAFDGSALFSDFVALEKIEANLRIELYINGALIQSGGVELMMYKPEQILSILNTYTTLEDGDIVMTGTPKGVGQVNAGDKFEGRVYAGDALLVSQQWCAE